MSFATSNREKPYEPVRPHCALSLVVGLLSLVLYGNFAMDAFHEKFQIKIDQHQRGQAYLDEFSTRTDYTNQLLPILTVLSALGACFFISAIVIIRGNFLGVIIARAYAITQIVLSLILGVVLMQAIYHSPAGMVFYFGGILGLVGCVYPTVLLDGLRNRSPLTD